MADVILRILSVLGILLLVLLALVIVLLLTVLFFPVTYRASGVKDEKQCQFRARAGWLFGLARVEYAFPEPGKLTVKVLWKTIYDSSRPPEKGKAEAGGSESAAVSAPGDKSTNASTPGDESTNASTPGSESTTGNQSGEPENPEQENVKQEKREQNHFQRETSEQENPVPETVEQENPEPENAAPETPEPENPEQENTGQEDGDAREGSGDEREKGGIRSRILEKIEKIKYTFRSTYDKIKKIWQNISYYMELLRDQDTADLLSHGRFRLFRILKSIRPRRLKADIRFGMESPDQTGYLYGIYCMLAPWCGSAATVTPDFQQKILEGHFQASGHIIPAVLGWHGLRIALDKRLWKLLEKIKQPEKPGSPQNKPETEPEKGRQSA